jgi:hypothetical protein
LKVFLVCAHSTPDIDGPWSHPLKKQTSRCSGPSNSFPPFNFPALSSITLRRCVVDRKVGKTQYDSWVEEVRALGDCDLGANEIDSTFFRMDPDPKGNIFYQKNDGATFTASFIAEIGSEEQGTWMAAYPKKSPPAHKLVGSFLNSFVSHLTN